MLNHRTARTLTVVSIIGMTVSGCAFFSQEERDALACEGMDSVITADRNADQKATPFLLASSIRREALPPASARLGRDIIGMVTALERTEEAGPGINVSETVAQLNAFSQRISERCVELTFAPGVANVAYISERPITSNQDTALPEDTDPTHPSENPDAGPDAQPDFFATSLTLRIEEEAPAGYDRGLFEHWIDADGDGCDTRREVLIQESLTPVTIGPGCFIDGGEWLSSYDGIMTTNPSEFDIDHLVPLKEAWDSGAYAWSDERRRDFANDLTNEVSLIAVTASSNRSKGADDPAEWLPPNGGFHCAYVDEWIEVKLYWNLSADTAEIAALEGIRAGC